MSRACVREGVRRAGAREEFVARISEHLRKKAMLWEMAWKDLRREAFPENDGGRVPRDAGEMEQMWGATERPS